MTQENKIGATELDKIKVLIADDHSVVRKGTRQILEQEPDLEVVGEASDGVEAVRLTESCKPNVAILDVAMPNMDGIEATKKIKSLHPEVAILILSAYDDDQFVFGLLDAGAAGYLLKSVRSYELVDAVRAVYGGESVLHPTIARKVLNRFKPDTAGHDIQKQFEELSERELEILKLATQGLSNQDIADKLHLSLRTVQAHLAHIFNKLQVGSRTEAAIRALKAGWITLDDLP